MRKNSERSEDDQTADGERSDDQLANDDEFANFQNLDAGALLQIERYNPNYAKGFIGDTTVPPEGIETLPSYIQQNWGGGAYLVRLKKRLLGGKIRFSKGSIRLDIAGLPKMPDGRSYPQHITGQVAPSPTAAGPLVIHQPSSTDINPKLLEMYHEALQKMGKGAGLPEVSTIVQLVETLRGAAPPPSEPKDPLEGFERQLAYFERMQKIFRTERNPKKEEPEDGDLLRAVIPELTRELARKYLGTGTPAPTQAAVQAPAQPPKLKIPPGYILHPSRGVIPESDLIPAKADVPVTVPESAPAPAPKTENVGETSENDEQEDEALSADEEALSADEMEEEFNGMDEAEQKKFVFSLLRKAGVDPETIG